LSNRYSMRTKGSSPVDASGRSRHRGLPVIRRPWLTNQSDNQFAVAVQAGSSQFVLVSWNRSVQLAEPGSWTCLRSAVSAHAPGPSLCQRAESSTHFPLAPDSSTPEMTCMCATPSSNVATAGCV
jgi:Tfp pilus assembly protein PilV